MHKHRRATVGDRRLPLLAALWSLTAAIAGVAAVWHLTTSSNPRRVLPQGETEATAASSADSLSQALHRARTGGNSGSSDVADGMHIAREAAKLPTGSTQRQRLLDTAIEQLQRGSVSRPFWGEAWTMNAYATALRDGPDAPATLSSFALGYRLSPYLKGSAGWRIAYGFANWQQLDHETRNAMLREAVWFSRRGMAERKMVFTHARGAAPDAYRAFMELWINSRVGDADFIPLKGQAPE